MNWLLIILVCIAIVAFGVYLYLNIFQKLMLNDIKKKFDNYFEPKKTITEQEKQIVKETVESTEEEKKPSQKKPRKKRSTKKTKTKTVSEK